MLEQFIPGLTPKSDLQEDLKYGFKLFGINQIGQSIFERMFKTRKQELEERMLEKQLELMGENPDTQALNKALLAAKTLENAPKFVSELVFTAKQAKASPLTLAQALQMSANNVDFRIPMQQTRAAYAKKLLGSIAKAI